MAIGATCIWEFRATATANMANGGGFIAGATGTDYSQQDAAQYSGTDLASANGTTNPSVVTSATVSFGPDCVGNIMRISAGTNWTTSTGWYQIVSVSGGAATLDRAVGTVASLSGGTFKIGGAFDFGTGINGWSSISAITQGGQKAYLKSGTYNPSQAMSTVANGGGSFAFNWEGYQTTRGDNPTGDNRPVLNFTGSNTFQPGSTFSLVKNLRFTQSGTTHAATAGANHVFDNCKFTYNGTTATAAALMLGSSSSIAKNCEAIGGRGIGIAAASSAVMVTNCYIHNCFVGINVNSGGGAVIVGNLVHSCASAAFNSTGFNFFLLNNTFVGSIAKSGDGAKVGTPTCLTRITNNIFYGFTTAINFTSAPTTSQGETHHVNGNLFYNNTTNRTNYSVGTNDLSFDPQFASVSELAGSTATIASTTTLTEASAPFATVTDNSDYIEIISGTNITGPTSHLITSHTSSTVTFTPAINGSTSATADKVWRIIKNKDFTTGDVTKGVASLSMNGNTSNTDYQNVGAVNHSVVSYTDVGVANVRAGTTYTYASVLKTGLLDLPAISDVALGTVYDNGTKTGTNTGSTVNSDPGIANVRVGTQYKVGSLTNNRTGTLDCPSAANVKIGVVFDNTTMTGTYDGSDRWTDPGDINVKDLVTYKANSTSLNKTGSLASLELLDVNLNLEKNSSGNLIGSFNVTKNALLLTTGLGAGSYTIYQKDGTTSTGVSQSGITAVSNVYSISSTSISGLTNGVYIMAVTVVVNSVSKTWYKPLAIFNLKPTVAADNSDVLKAINGVKALVL